MSAEHYKNKINIMNQNNNKVYAFLAIITLCVLTIGLGMYTNLRSKINESIPTVSGGFTSTLCDNNNNSGATTTLQYLATASTASTTLTCYTDGADQIDLDLFAVASSSSSGLVWNVSYSNNNKDFYYENGTTVTSNVVSTEGPVPLTHVWSPATAATSTKDVQIKTVNAKYTRIEMHAVGAGFGLYEALIDKNIIRN